MQHIVQSMIEASRRVRWRKLEQVPEALARVHSRVFEGTSDGWRFVVADFPIEDQGFPTGARGSEGMATNAKAATVVRLPKGVAESLIVEALVQALV